MSWNSAHINEVRYKEPDLQAAYQHFRDLMVFYEVQIARKYRLIDSTPVQEAWNRYLKLRKQHGYPC